MSSKFRKFAVVIGFAAIALAGCSDSWCDVPPGAANCQAPDGTIVYASSVPPTPTKVPQVVTPIENTVTGDSDNGCFMGLCWSTKDRPEDKGIQQGLAAAGVSTCGNKGTYKLGSQTFCNP
jgi:hypothetical protein